MVMPLVETSYAGALALWALLRPKRQYEGPYRWLDGALTHVEPQLHVQPGAAQRGFSTTGTERRVKRGLPIVERFVGIAALDRAVWY
jgi:hypothetical protein